jgi:hypothetical protein
MGRRPSLLSIHRPVFNNSRLMGDTLLPLLLLLLLLRMLLDPAAATAVLVMRMGRYFGTGTTTNSPGGSVQISRQSSPCASSVDQGDPPPFFFFFFVVGCCCRCGCPFVPCWNGLVKLQSSRGARDVDRRILVMDLSFVAHSSALVFRDGTNTLASFFALLVRKEMFD